MKDIQKLAEEGEFNMVYGANQIVREIMEHREGSSTSLKTKISQWRFHRDRMKDMGLKVESYDNKISEITKRYRSLPC